MLDLSIFLVFLSGMLMFLSPCIFPLFPIYLTILNKDNSKVRNTIFFILGISVSFLTLGTIFDFIGNFLYTPLIRKTAGIIVIILGLIQLELIKLDFFNKTKLINIKIKYKSSAIESFMLGLTFSLGWTPCVGPILSTILIYAGDKETSISGLFLLSIFIIGFTTPFLIFTIFYEKLISKTIFIKRNGNIIKKISALVIILMGILLYFNSIEEIIIFFERMTL